MLVEFSFGNFRSFKEIQTLQLEAANIVSKNKEMDENNVMTQKGLDLLKFKAIYGANGSGKSNVLSVLSVFLTTVKESFKDDNILKYIIPFYLDEKSIKAPSFFQIIFIYKDIEYRYGFEADKKRIHTEWLFVKDKKEVPYFLRTGQEIEYYNKGKFQEAKILFNKDGNILRENSLMISVLFALNGKISTIITEYFRRNFAVVSGLENIWANRLPKLLEDSKFKERVLNFLKSIDSLIHGINVIGEDRNKKIFIERKMNSKSEKIITFFLDLEEGEGTKKLFYLSPVLFGALDYGLVMVVDEFDARLHPILSRKIVELFNSEETNSKGAQLIVITHDTNLLDNDLLRRDQIVFAEKNKYGESQLVDLVEFKGVKNTASYEKDYLRGKFGALPYLNQLDLIFQK